MTEKEKVRSRFAPSPTGFLHIGGARTALFAWLYARHYNGQFILRIEDTDQLRSTEESTRAILDALAWLGLDWDEGPFFQAQRVDMHREMVKKLLDEGKAYHCVCTPEELEEKRKRAFAEGRKPKYDGTCRDKNLPGSANAAVRFRCPHTGVTVVNDLIKGVITFNNEELDDLVIERSDGYPTYNFAVVVDDAQMEITHVIRGDDHVNNTPRQILLYEALGYLPEGLVNYLVRLGWSHGDQEIFTMEELIRLFTFDSVGKSAAVFNPEKLLWLNQHYIKECPPVRLVQEMIPFWQQRGVDTADQGFLRHIVDDVKSRSKTLVELAESSLFYFADDVAYESEAADAFLKAEMVDHLTAVAHGIPSLQDYTKKGIEAFLRTLTEDRGFKLKVIAQPLRVALTGKTVSPGIDDIMVTLGKERVIKRITRAVEYIKKRA
jgi:glutamyl-tRNA synthetase